MSMASNFQDLKKPIFEEEKDTSKAFINWFSNMVWITNPRTRRREARKMMKEEKGRERHRLENIAKDRKVIPDPIDDRKFQE